MSASKARRVDRIHPDPDPSKWMVTVTDPKTDETSVVLLASLVRPELTRAAKLAFPDTDGRGWIHFSNVAILEAIVTETLPEGIEDAVGKMQAPRPKSAGEPKRDAVIERLEARVRDLERRLSEAPAASGIDLVRAVDAEGVTILIGVLPPHALDKRPSPA